MVISLENSLPGVIYKHLFIFYTRESLDFLESREKED